MDKLDMQSMNVNAANVEKIAALFPSCVTERLNSKGVQELAIDFDKLRMELGSDVLDDTEERYQFTWPDKREAIRLSNARTTKTLRPCREESVDFDNTENLYVEGDNLEVLKVLQQSYLGKVKMIYIDPPYNTGKDFVYKDKRVIGSEDYAKMSGQYDEKGNQLVKNTESNGRFHTDWLNFLYPRLKVARNLLCEDGVIFLSIDDNEVVNLKKICDEIFGEQNFESMITWRRRTNQPNDKSKMVAKVAENILVYAKDSIKLVEKKGYHGVPFSEKRRNEYTNPDNDQNGPWSSNPWKAAVGRGGTTYAITTPTGVTYNETWYGTKENFEKHVKDGRVHWTDGGNGVPRIKVYLSEAEKEGQAAINFFTCDKYGSNQEGSSEVEDLFKMKGIFDNPKPVRLIKALLALSTHEDSIIIDFFSGSATTAHAVMQLNAEDNGHRQHIMVQLPEVLDEKTTAYKAGYRNICEIGKERIRRAGKKIKQQSHDLDTGFRVLKLAESNMKDVYYTPSAINEQDLWDSQSNIKEDRTPEDILFQIMPECGVKYSEKIEVLEIAGKKVFSVMDNYLAACFDDNINEEVITAIAKTCPTYFVMRDSSLESDNVADNFMQIFKQYSPETNCKII